MAFNLLLINVKNNAFLVNLNSNTFLNNGVILSNGDKMYGDPFIMKNNDELHVLMSWADHNAKSIGQVVGHLVKETNKFRLYNENVLESLKDILNKNESIEIYGPDIKYS